MKVILYTVGCPKCGQLERQLKKYNIQYEVCTDIEVMKEKGLKSAPWLEIDGELLDFGKAWKWCSKPESDAS